MIRNIVATAIFLILDGIWLGIIAKQLYIDALGNLLRMSDGNLNPNWLAAIIVYIALITAIILFAVPKANGQLLPAFFWGACLGLVMYITYDFTNLATLKNWSWSMSLIDVAWGTILCGLTSMITVWITG